MTTFKDFYDTYFQKVFHFLKSRTFEEADAKDLTHDVFLKALNNFSKVCEAKNIEAYLFTIVRNILVDFYKRSLQEKPFSSTLEQGIYNQEVSQMDDTTTIENIQHLHKAIDSLPEQRKKILIRKKLQGQSTKEISEELQLSTRTVENQLYRAMVALRKQMAQFFSSFL